MTIKKPFLLVAAILLGPATALGQAPGSSPRYLNCQGLMERTCTTESCTEFGDPPMEVSLDLEDGDGSFCLYTFCGDMESALASQGNGVYGGRLHVVANVNGEVGLMSYDASFDVSKMTFSVFTASGDELSIYSGTCSPRNNPDANE